MDLPLKEVSKFLDSANNILIIGSQNPSVDIISSAIGWNLFLSKKGKSVDIVFDGSINIPDFLPNSVEVNNSIDSLSNFKIVLDVSKTKVKQLSYDTKEDQLHINIIPQDGSFSDKDVKIDKGDIKYDLIISLGASVLESLGDIFVKHREFFLYHIPVLNIDRSVLNENFGQLNIVESTASSLSEISYNILKKHIDKDLATCFLGGIISATNSFQSAQVTPQLLELSSELMIKGAERDKIVESLYRTKDIKTLKSWGKVLSRLQEKDGVITSYLNHNETDYLPEDFQEMVKDLVLSTPDSKLAIIFYQKELQQTEAWIYTRDNINALEITKELYGEGDRRFVKIVIDKDIDSAKELLVDKLTNKLKMIYTA